MRYEPVCINFLAKVVALLVNMIFAVPYLEISRKNALDHLELFAGDCSITRAEHQDTRVPNYVNNWGQPNSKLKF